MNKKIMLGFIAIFILSYGKLQADENGFFKPGAEPNGFSGIPWGSSVEKFTGLEEVVDRPTYGSVKLYTDEQSEYEGVGGIKLMYSFFNDRFFKVEVTVGMDKCDEFKKMLFNNFGKGKLGLAGYSRAYSWDGENSIMMFMDCNDLLNMTAMSFSSKAIEEESIQELRKEYENRIK